MNREALTCFIKRYKFHTCLWDLSNPDYTNKYKRVNALKDLMPILGKNATIDQVRKKIDILRNGYFRELKKVNASLSISTCANDVYAPTLWYYNMMSFLTTPDTSVPESDGHEDPLRVAVAVSGGVPSRRKSTKVKEKSTDDDKNVSTEDNPNIAVDQEQDLSFGLYLNNRLQHVPNDQRVIAEKLMSDVLFMARTNQLNATSQIYTDPSTQITTTSEHSSSPSQYITEECQVTYSPLP